MSKKLKDLQKLYLDRQRLTKIYSYGTETHMTALYEMRSIAKQIIALGGKL